MPSLSFGITDRKRARGDLPEMPVKNMFAEEAPTEEKGVVLHSRPPLADRGANMGSGPVKALFQRDNVLSTALFGVSGSNLYSGTTSLGAVDGNGPFSIAGYENFLFVAGGSSLWGYNGSSLAAITLPDSFSAIKVIVGASRAVVIRQDTGKFYWSDPLETDIEALDFATAENVPDRALDLLFIDDILIVFGAETVEFWPNTRDAELPFKPLESRVIEKGIKATGCATGVGSTFAWVTNENTVCVQDENNIISTPGLQARIEASSTCSLFTFLIEGQEFLALRIDNETQVYNMRSGQWSEFSSEGQTNFIPQCSTGTIFGSAVDGKTLTWGTGHQDLGGTLERRFRAGLPLNGGGFIVKNMRLRCNPGQTPFLSGDYADPQVEMRLSRDAGQTWGEWRATSLGSQGKYRLQPEWRACGMASQPGLFAEFRVTDPVPWSVTDVRVNEPVGGR